MLQRGEISVKITAKTDVFFSVCESHSICHCSQIKDWCFPPPLYNNFFLRVAEENQVFNGFAFVCESFKEKQQTPVSCLSCSNPRLHKGAGD